ncbi:MAG: TRAP transporter small permease [Sphaerochaetaceae bacterium]|nr:TRAP transporter small permease [Sphaerochaetaceae bacterium]
MQTKPEKLFEQVFSVYAKIQIACLILITVLLFGQVIIREVFSIGLQWVYELSCMLQVTMIWLGLPSLLYHGEDIKITVLYDIAPPMIKKGLKILSYLVILSSVIMISAGYVMYMDKLAFTKSAAMRMPNYLFFGAFPFGIIMIILVLIFKTKSMLQMDSSADLNTGDAK